MDIILDLLSGVGVKGGMKYFCYVLTYMMGLSVRAQATQVSSLQYYRRLYGILTKAH